MKAVPINVTAAATLLLSEQKIADLSATLLNSGTNTVFLGGADVTAANGYPLAAGLDAVVQLPGGSGETLYGICAAGQTSVVNVLRTGT